jgi:hypothetical protein
VQQNRNNQGNVQQNNVKIGRSTHRTKIKHTTAAHNQGNVQQNNIKIGSSTRNTKPRHSAAKTTPKQAAAQPKTLML